MRATHSVGDAGERRLGTERLLLVLVGEGERIAAGVLASLGVTLEKVRPEVSRALAQSSSSEPGGRNVAPMTVVPAPIPVEEASRALEISRSYVGIGASPLRRVVGIGQVARDAGVSVELITLEIREAGCTLHWKAHPDRERSLGERQFVSRTDCPNVSRPGAHPPDSRWRRPLAITARELPGR